MSELPSLVDIVIVGGGLAGLAAATDICATGRTCVVLESSDAPGGRVRTDAVDGMLLDRGFQLLNPAYPQAAKMFDLAALELRPFQAGAVIAHGEGRYVLSDPRRSPREALSGARLPLGSLREKAAFARWAATVGFGSVSRIKRRPDSSTAAGLAARGVHGPLIASVIRPFLSGVLGEDDLSTSMRFTELLVRSFVRGTPGIPAAGMQALPNQLAAALPPAVLRCNTTVVAVRDDGVDTTAGVVRARAVIVAADPRTAARLTGMPAPTMRALTTFYHVLPVGRPAPASRTLLHLDADRRGPVANTAVVSAVAPSYSPDRHLIATTVLGRESGSAMERDALRHAGVIYGVDTSEWESVAAYPISAALPAMAPGSPLRKRVAVGPRLFVAGDHRDTPSIQGALVSGRRAAAAAISSLMTGGR